MAKKKKEKKGGKYMKKKELAEIMVNYFHNRPTDSFSMKQLYAGLGLTTHPLKMLCADIVEEMLEDDFLVRTENGHYKLRTSNDRHFRAQEQREECFRTR